MEERNKSSILICTNRKCSNERVWVAGPKDSKAINCAICGSKLTSIDVSTPALPVKMVAERELSARSKGAGWIGFEEYSMWPGPIAFEYSRLRDIMADGNIEGACWKIANLAEVTISFLTAAALERIGSSQRISSLESISKKSEFVKLHFKDKYLNNLLATIG